MRIPRGLYPALMAMAPLALAGCGDGAAPAPAAPSLDEELAAPNAVDPLLASVVHDPLMTDPQLTSRANANAIRPPDGPVAALIPGPDIAPAGPETPMPPAPAAAGDCRACTAARRALTLAALAAAQDDQRMRTCAPRMGYAAGWSTNLPADLPLPPSARVIEAAGTNRGGCTLRAVSFAVAEPPARAIDWYHARAGEAGYATVHQAADGLHRIAGRRARDGAAFAVFVADDGRVRVLTTARD